MSSILKALQKLEEEKLTRSGTPPRIDSEILRHGMEPPRSSAARNLLLAAVLFLCGAGAASLYLKQPSPRPPQGDGETAAPAKLLSVSETPSANERQSPLPTERIVPDTIVAAPPDTHATQPRPDTTPPRASSKSTNQNRSLRAKPATTTPKQASPPAAGKLTSRPAPPTLRVNGISYQEGVDSVAVINGTPVSRGGVIEGARVEEIRRDRVIFSSGEKRFEIQLGRANR